MSLVLAGLLSGAFFWATDPKYGWVHLQSSSDNVVDAIREASVATYVGLAGSAFVLLLGLWLLTRRTA